MAASPRAGSVGSIYVEDVDCAFEVDLRLDGGTARVRFANRAREKVAGRLARVEAQLAAAQKAAEEQGPIARRFQSRVRALEESKAKLAEELAGLGTHPLPFELELPLRPAEKPSGRIAAELPRRGGKLEVVVLAGDEWGAVAVEEARLLPSSQAPGGG